MNLLRKCLGRARIWSSNRQEFGDNNEQGNKSADIKSESERIENHNLREPVNEYMVKMLNLIRELTIFCLVFMAYAAITNE